MSRGRVGNRIAGYDDNGVEIYDSDVLTDEELAEDAARQAAEQGWHR